MKRTRRLRILALFMALVISFFNVTIVSKVDNKTGGVVVKVTKKTIYMNQVSRKKVTAMKQKCTIHLEYST